MSRGHIARIPPTVDQHGALTRFERLHHDLRLVPRAHATSPNGKQHPLAARQHLRAVRLLALLEPDQHLGGAGTHVVYVALRDG